MRRATGNGRGGRLGSGAAWRGTAPSGTPAGRCESAKWTSCWQERCKRWRTSLAYDGERVDGRVLDQLETVLRHVADELASWRARALKAEAELKESGLRGGGGGAGGGGGTKPDAETRGRVAGLEQENRTLRQRVEGAHRRVHDLLSRLTFLEEQARQTGGNGGGTGGGTGAGSAGRAWGRTKKH